MNNQPTQIIHIKLREDELQELIEGRKLGWFEEGTTDDGRHVDIEIKIEKEDK